jgi:hypothetical protein
LGGLGGKYQKRTKETFLIGWFRKIKEYVQKNGVNLQSGVNQYSEKVENVFRRYY